MTRARITFNKGSYRISISKKLIDDSGLQEKGSTKPIPVKIETSKKLGCLLIHDFKFRELPDPALKELPIDRAIAEGYFDDVEEFSAKRKTFRKCFVDLSNLPEEAANDPVILKIKEEADALGRKILDAHREYDHKTKKDVERLKKLHRDFRYKVSQHLAKPAKRPQLGDTHKPSQYDKL